jgi:DNA-binding MarR family transcriptional regulator
LDSVDDWEGFVEGLARDLVSALRRRLYGAHLDRLRGLGAPSEKLIYLYLLLAEPQSFTTIRRGLALGGRTVDIALRRLRERGYVTQDIRFLYWIKDAKAKTPL